ncbi:MAG: hypothetical protein HY730_05385 [Candidatus Tectomicrobia bacterium]|uniref:HD domain-containing protein n=1 Tax=Tectimicrobiota bacterium TaxID=2528274 RepID=A0A933GLI4_UNCTE|nr:hypothetical protein [Candidatus Tectomicrobia bacterium]
MNNKVSDDVRSGNIKIYQAVREAAVNFAEHLRQASFYNDFREELDLSRRLYERQELITKCLDLLGGCDNSYGHGNYHMRTVALEAGALSLIEATRRGLKSDEGTRLAVLAQISGLLHDIKRKEKNHAEAGAVAAQDYLLLLSIAERERGYIITAIKNHEAFKDQSPIDGFEGAIISEALYDADKFRWGPDNFTITLWSMLEYGQIRPEDFLSHYPKGIEGVIKIRDTFRSLTGKKYGPEFIDLGLMIGEKIYETLKLMVTGQE